MSTHKILIVPARDGVPDAENPTEYRFFRNDGYPEFEQRLDVVAVLTPTFHPWFKRHGWSMDVNPADRVTPTGYYNPETLADGYLPRQLQQRMFVEHIKPEDKNRWGTLQDFADILATLIKPAGIHY